MEERIDKDALKTKIDELLIEYFALFEEYQVQKEDLDKKFKKVFYLKQKKQ